MVTFQLWDVICINDKKIWEIDVAAMMMISAAAEELDVSIGCDNGSSPGY